MLTKNYLPKDHPYFESKTEKQWKLLKRVINTDAVGETMYFNGHRQQSGKFYLLEETRPATEEELAVWRTERREKAKEKREQKKAKQEEQERREKEELARERARKKRLLEMDKAKILCLDVETTGLYPAFDEILQLSIIDGNGEVLFNQYICPKEHTEWEEAEQIHGISPSTVASESTIDGYIPVLEQILSKAELLVGYNILKFDLWFLHCAGLTLQRLKLVRFLCTFTSKYTRKYIRLMSFHKTFTTKDTCVSINDSIRLVSKPKANLLFVFNCTLNILH